MMIDTTFWPWWGLPLATAALIFTLLHLLHPPCLVCALGPHFTRIIGKYITGSVKDITTGNNKRVELSGASGHVRELPPPGQLNDRDISKEEEQEETRTHGKSPSQDDDTTGGEGQGQQEGPKNEQDKDGQEDLTEEQQEKEQEKDEPETKARTGQGQDKKSFRKAGEGQDEEMERTQQDAAPFPSCNVTSSAAEDSHHGEAIPHRMGIPTSAISPFRAGIGACRIEGPVGQPRPRCCLKLQCNCNEPADESDETTPRSTVTSTPLLHPRDKPPGLMLDVSRSHPDLIAACSPASSLASELSPQVALSQATPPSGELHALADVSPDLSRDPDGPASPGATPPEEDDKRNTIFNFHVDGKEREKKEKETNVHTTAHGSVRAELPFIRWVMEPYYNLSPTSDELEALVDASIAQPPHSNTPTSCMSSATRDHSRSCSNLDDTWSFCPVPGQPIERPALVSKKSLSDLMVKEKEKEHASPSSTCSDSYGWLQLIDEKRPQETLTAKIAHRSPGAVRKLHATNAKTARAASGVSRPTRNINRSSSSGAPLRMVRFMSNSEYSLRAPLEHKRPHRPPTPGSAHMLLLNQKRDATFAQRLKAYQKKYQSSPDLPQLIEESTPGASPHASEQQLQQQHVTSTVTTLQGRPGGKSAAAVRSVKTSQTAAADYDNATARAQQVLASARQLWPLVHSTACRHAPTRMPRMLHCIRSYSDYQILCKCFSLTFCLYLCSCNITCQLFTRARSDSYLYFIVNSHSHSESATQVEAISIIP
eukprot:g16411.t1